MRIFSKILFAITFISVFCLSNSTLAQSAKTIPGPFGDRQKIDVEVLGKVLRAKLDKIKELAEDDIIDEIEDKSRSAGYNEIIKEAVRSLVLSENRVRINRLIADASLIFLVERLVRGKGADKNIENAELIIGNKYLAEEDNAKEIIRKTTRAFENAAVARVLYSIDNGPAALQKLADSLTEDQKNEIENRWLKNVESTLDWLRNRWGGNIQDVYGKIANDSGISLKDLTDNLDENTEIGQFLSEETHTVLNISDPGLLPVIELLKSVDTEELANRNLNITDKIIRIIGEEKPFSKYCKRETVNCEAGLVVFVEILESLPEYIVKTDDGFEFESVQFATETAKRLQKLNFGNYSLYLAIGITKTASFDRKDSATCQDEGLYCEGNSLAYYHDKIGLKAQFPSFDLPTKSAPTTFHINLYAGGLLYQVEPHTGSEAGNDLANRWLLGGEFGWYVYEAIEINAGYQQLRRLSGTEDLFSVLYINASVPIDEYLKEIAGSD